MILISGICEHIHHTSKTELYPLNISVNGVDGWRVKGEQGSQGRLKESGGVGPGFRYLINHSGRLNDAR
jgi:hypothetical protein